LLCGIGFTMSLFIGSLAFEDAARIGEVKLGVLGGSFVSALLGFALLRMSSKGEPLPSPAAGVVRR
jgi:NhaA family Na+:H+ antiporter